MNKIETAKLLSVLKAYFPRIYATKDMDAMFLIELWTQEFGGYDYGIVRRSICDLCNRTQFAPSIAEIRQTINGYVKKIEDAKLKIEQSKKALDQPKCKDCHPESYMDVLEKCGGIVCTRSKEFRTLVEQRQISYQMIMDKVNPNSLIEIEERLDFDED